MKKPLIFLLSLALIILLCSCDPPESDQQATEVNSSNSEAAYLLSPFRIKTGDSDWYLTQAFGAYYDSMQGSHYGEDWNRAAGNSDIGELVYSIGVGEVIDTGYYSNLGGYVVVKHQGTFIVPSSSGPHLLAGVSTTNDPGWGSKSPGLGIVNSLDVFSSNELFDNDFYEEQDYYYDYNEYKTIYSVYLHVDPLVDKGYIIKESTINEPIANLADISSSGMSSHLHLEIRVEDPTKYSLFPDYFENSQDMIDIGYREPSSVIQANLQEGEVLGQSVESIAVTQEDSIQNGIYNIDLGEIISKVEDGYLMECFILEQLAISYEEYMDAVAGKPIDTAIGEMQLEYEDDEGIFFGLTSYNGNCISCSEIEFIVPMIITPPTQGTSMYMYDFFSYDDYSYITNNVDTITSFGEHYYPIFIIKETIEIIIPSNATVSVEDLDLGGFYEKSFDDYINSTQYYPTSFIATIENDKITELIERFQGYDV